MSFDSVTQKAATGLARRYSRRKALGIFAGAGAVLGLGSVALGSARASAASGTFTLVNQTGQTIWPGIAGNAIADGGGFELDNGASATITLSANWSGRIWARTYCGSDGTGCETGDCGALACNGASGQGNATLAEFTLGNGTAPDYYDVSLVDAFSLPLTIVPQGGSGCTTAGCTANLLPGCPSDLQSVDGSGNIVACLSSCTEFGGDQYCCTGDYLDSCDPSSWAVNSASYFKSGCPDAYSYATDTVTSTFACSGASGYVITFYPFSAGSGSSATTWTAVADPSPDPATTTTTTTTTTTAPPPPPGHGGWGGLGGWR